MSSEDDCSCEYSGNSSCQDDSTSENESTSETFTNFSLQGSQKYIAIGSKTGEKVSGYDAYKAKYIPNFDHNDGNNAKTRLEFFRINDTYSALRLLSQPTATLGLKRDKNHYDIVFIDIKSEDDKISLQQAISLEKSEGIIIKFAPYFIDTSNQYMTQICLRVVQNDDTKIVYFDSNGTARLITFELKYIPNQCILSLTRL